MRIEFFKYLIKREIDIFYFDETMKIAIFKKPYCIENDETGESVNFKTIDEMLEYKIGDETVRDIILRTDKPYIPPLDGGRGSRLA